MMPQDEREYFGLAGVWLGARQDLLAAATDRARLWHFLGEMDYHAEMHLLIQGKPRDREGPQGNEFGTEKTAKTAAAKTLKGNNRQ